MEQSHSNRFFNPREAELNQTLGKLSQEERAAFKLESDAKKLGNEIVTRVVEWLSLEASPGDTLNMRVVKAAEDTPENKVHWRVKTRALDLANQSLLKMGIPSEVSNYAVLHGELSSKHILSVPGKKLTVAIPSQAHRNN